jgi:hypothetical protein
MSSLYLKDGKQSLSQVNSSQAHRAETTKGYTASVKDNWPAFNHDHTETKSQESCEWVLSADLSY